MLFDSHLEMFGRTTRVRVNMRQISSRTPLSPRPFSTYIRNKAPNSPCHLSTRQCPSPATSGEPPGSGSLSQNSAHRLFAVTTTFGSEPRASSSGKLVLGSPRSKSRIQSVRRSLQLTACAAVSTVRGAQSRSLSRRRRSLPPQAAIGTGGGGAPTDTARS